MQHKTVMIISLLTSWRFRHRRERLRSSCTFCNRHINQSRCRNFSRTPESIIRGVWFVSK